MNEYPVATAQFPLCYHHLGSMDSKILMKLHQREQRRIHAVIVEPNAPMMERYKALVVKESEMMRGIDFEWRQETLEEFQKSPTGQKDDKFHFINFFNTVYYLEDKEKSLRYLYDKLDVGGVLVITVMSGMFKNGLKALDPIGNYSK